MSLSREASLSHRGFLLNLRVTCEQVWSDCGQGTGMGPRVPFQEVPTVCSDTSCQGAPAFPGALHSADGFLKL